MFMLMYENLIKNAIFQGAVLALFAFIAGVLYFIIPKNQPIMDELKSYLFKDNLKNTIINQLQSSAFPIITYATSTTELENTLVQIPIMPKEHWIR